MGSLLLETPDAEYRLKMPEEASLYSEEGFLRLCQMNEHLRIERDASGEIVVMAPSGSESGRRNMALGAQLYYWAKEDGSGIAFDSSTGFELPDGSVRSPDAAWVRHEVWARVNREAKERFAPVCPDFVIELRSKADRRDWLESKMRAYLDNGTRLGLLIDPIAEEVMVFRLGEEPTTWAKPTQISAEPEMPKLSFDLTDVWG